ncbi:MAG: type IV secretory system conjugative DNA transfer family protein, partial [Chloroflexota bacterium]
ACWPARLIEAGTLVAGLSVLVLVGWLRRRSERRGGEELKMRRLGCGILLALALAGLVGLGTAPGRQILANARIRIEHRATALYHQLWVTAAWPAENAFLLFSHQGSLIRLPVSARTRVAAPAGEAAGAGLIGWSAWQRSGVETRWRQFQAHTAEATRVRQLVTFEFWLVPLLVLAILAKPLWTLTARLGRLRPGSGHGTARLATARELRALKPRRHTAGLRLGQVGRQPVALPEAEVYEHVLVCGPPGSGKSSGLILPNILAERGARSLVIVDPKSDLLALSRDAVSRHSEVWVVNFLDPDHSHGYNPLALVSDYLSAEAFADCWITNTGRSAKEPFWDNAAKQLIVAAVLHLRAEKRGSPPTLSDLAEFFTRHDDQTITAILGASRSEHARNCAVSFLASMSK